MPSPSPSTPCPSEDDVARFLEGDLDREQLATMEEHLATCRRCPAVIANAGRASSPALDSTAVAEPADRAPPVASETRIGRYVVQFVVGTGAMGRVYAAYDPTLDRRVALKLLHRGAGNADLEARLLREAKAMARLAHHQEIVPVYDAGRHDAHLFIAMEFVDGGTLRAWLAARRRSWREIAAVFQHAGRGLAHAHAAGLVHRDFKPDNVLVGRDGRVRVTDFGLARVLRDGPDAPSVGTGLSRSAGGAVQASLTRTGTLVGTPAYMAPEQLDGTADAQSDIFSFCVAFYEALYGERPFGGSTIAELHQSVTAGRIAPPREPRTVPRGLNRVLRVGLRPRPGDRPASMTELLAAVERATHEPRILRVGFGASLVAVAVVALALAWRGSPQGSPPVPAPIAEAARPGSPIAEPARPGSPIAEPARLGSPSSLVASSEAPRASFATVAPSVAPSLPPPQARPSPPRPPARGHLVAAVHAATASPSPDGDDAPVVEGRNGAPIMR